MAPRIENDAEEEFEIQELHDPMESSRETRFSLLKNEFNLSFNRKLSQEGILKGFRELKKFVIHPENRWYQLWVNFVLICAVYSSFFTPMEFGFFRGLPKNLFLLDIASQVAFLADILVQFVVAYRDEHSYRMIYKRRYIAMRYLKSSFIWDLLACLPWDVIYGACGRKEGIRYLLWVRLCRLRKITAFLQKMEKDIRINYLFTRIVKLIAVELYCTHTAACIFYYLATVVPASREKYTWIGSLKLGSYSYENFREIDLLTRYLTSLYFAIITMATVGYGDIHAVNTKEMIFIMVFVSFDMILGAYLIGNMTALIVKGSKTERFRDKMTDLIRFMNRNKLGKSIREQVKGHVRLQYESSYTEASILRDIPISIRSKISQSLYRSFIEKVPLFKGCSSEFLNQIVLRVHEEFFLPGEVIIEQRNAVDQLYFVCHGLLEAVMIGEDGTEEILFVLEPDCSFGEVSLLCNIPQTYTVRVLELCRLLRIDKQSLSNILEVYFFDGRTILNNLLEEKESNVSIKQLEIDIAFHIGKQETELASNVNSAAFNGDLSHVKGLVRAGANPKKTDYDGRSPLHLAAAKGYEDIVAFLIKEGVDINATDAFGNTPLLEATKNGHDAVASLLLKNGALLKLKDAGCFLCASVSRGDADLIRRLLSSGADPNSKDYDFRTPLHVAAADGLYFIAKILLEAGASVLSKDRWGNTPVDEAHICGSKSLIRLMENARSSQLSELPLSSQQTQERGHPKKCTVYPFHPWDPKEKGKEGIVLWIPQTLDELLKISQEELKCTSSSIMTEDAGKILDVRMISDGQKLYLDTTKQ